jgi:hypothetical protein
MLPTSDRGVLRSHSSTLRENGQAPIPRSTGKFLQPFLFCPMHFSCYRPAQAKKEVTRAEHMCFCRLDPRRLKASFLHIFPIRSFRMYHVHARTNNGDRQQPPAQCRQHNAASTMPPAQCRQHNAVSMRSRFRVSPLLHSLHRLLIQVTCSCLGFSMSHFRRS